MEEILHLRELCKSQILKSKEKFEKIKELYNLENEEGVDIIKYYYDILAYIDDDEKINECVEILQEVCFCNDINSHTRLITASNLMNRGFLDVCYICFETIAMDPSVEYKYRLDACKFLYGSGIDENEENAINIIKNITNDCDINIQERYESILNFDARNGIKTFIDYNRLRVEYDEEVVNEFLETFLANENNNIRYRILCAQNLLQKYIKSEDEEKLDEKLKFLVAVSEDETHDHRTKADAADILYRESPYPVLKEKARRIIATLGFETLSANEVKTIYKDEENVHRIENSVEQFVEKFLSSSEVRLPPYETISNEIIRMIRGLDVEYKIKFEALKTMNRFKIDKSVFTKYKVSITDVLSFIWLKINDYDDKCKETLKERLFEELRDMNGTCSSGYCGRLINILSGFEDVINITWEEQIISNFDARFNARVKQLDEDNQECITVGIIDKNEEYFLLVRKILKEVYDELFKEFVGEEWVKEDTFINIYLSFEKKYL